MTGKRSRLEMYLDVLEKISQGISKPTNIMYKCNLSWRPLQEILGLLIEKGLIEEVELENHKYYKATEKGERILLYLRKIIQMLNPTRHEEYLTSKRRSLLMMKTHES